MTPTQQLYSWTWLAEMGYWHMSMDEIDAWERERLEWRKTLPRLSEKAWARVFGIDATTLAPKSVYRATDAFPDAATVKARVSLLEIAGEYTALTQRGRDWWGSCPLHDERTPSFKVNEERGQWYCFAESRGGDVFSLIMEKEKLSFKEALEVLNKT